MTTSPEQTLWPRPELPAENVYGHRKKIAFILETVDRRQATADRPLRVLDFGCGSGTTIAQYILAERFAEDGTSLQPIEYWGIDIHDESLEYARRHFSTPTAHFEKEVPQGLIFDVIIYADVLEHLDDPAAFLAEHHKQLASDGVMVASIPNGYGGFENERRLDRWLHLTPIAKGVLNTYRRLRGRPRPPPPTVPFNLESGHLVFFTKRLLLTTLSKANLRLGKFQHGTFVGADFSSATIFRLRPLLKLNAWLADFLPSWAVSTWHFEIHPADDGR